MQATKPQGAQEKRGEEGDTFHKAGMLKQLFYSAERYNSYDAVKPRFHTGNVTFVFLVQRMNIINCLFVF